MYPGEDPIGKRIRPVRGQSAWHTVVGVAKDVGDKASYYSTWRRRPAGARRTMILAMRTNAPPAWLRQEIAALDSQLPVQIETMQRRISEQWSPRRFTAWLVALFAAFGLLLAVAGLSGAASYLVEQRRREIGVRMALGATPAGVARQVLAEAAIWTAAGACGGVALAATAARLIRSQFVGVTAADPLSWAAAIAILALALAAAVMRPAIRAARTDPAVTLRSE